MCRTGGRRCPGSHGSSRATQNTRKSVSRAKAALRAAKAAGDEDAIAAARQRLTDARAAHEQARNTLCRNDEPAPHGGDVTARALRPPAEPPTTVEPLGDGSVSDTELLTYPDGTRLVRKHNGAKARECGADPLELTDAEELAPHVLDAVGLNYAAVHRTASDEVLMEFVDGRSGTDVTGGGRLSDTDRDSHDGRLLGLADHLIGNLDRNPDNWLKTPDGRLVGIDHGAAFDANRFSSSPFARALYDTSNPVPELRDNQFTPADLDHVGRRLEALRPEFEKHGRADWHDSVMRRHRELADHATGTTNLVAPDTATTPAQRRDVTTAHTVPTPDTDPTPNPTPPSRVDNTRDGFERHPQVRKFRAHPFVRSGRMTAEDMAREWNKDPMVQIGMVKPIPIPGEPGDVTTHHTEQRPPTDPTPTREQTHRQRPTDPTPTRERHRRHHDDESTRHHDDNRQKQDRKDTRGMPFLINNVNYAAPGAHVGSQHDVTGDPASVDTADLHDRLRHAQQRLNRATNRTNSDRWTDDRRSTHNTADDDDDVDIQIGFNFGDLFRRD
ncbi:MAG: hypothetical protein HOY78_04430 [Saccharothrix sp.]|nr:hypothetical protein [Saccharothrix sp.]